MCQSVQDTSMALKTVGPRLKAQSRSFCRGLTGFISIDTEKTNGANLPSDEPLPHPNRFRQVPRPTLPHHLLRGLHLATPGHRGRASGPLQMPCWPPGCLPLSSPLPRRVPPSGLGLDLTSFQRLSLIPLGHSRSRHVCDLSVYLLLSFSLDSRVHLSWPLHKSDRLGTKRAIVNLYSLNAYHTLLC